MFWSDMLIKTKLTILKWMNPRNVMHNVFDSFFGERYVKIERVKSGRASAEKGVEILNEINFQFFC